MKYQQPYRFKLRVATTPLHSCRKPFSPNLLAYEERKQFQKDQQVKALQFRKSFEIKWPLKEAALIPIKQAEKIARHTGDTKGQRKALRRYFARARRILKAPPIHKAIKHRAIRFTYNEYISSHLWEGRKNRFYQKFGRACAVCLTSSSIHLHHMVYTAYDGNEPDGNLIALCQPHHAAYHSKYGTSRSMKRTTMEFVEAERAAALR